MLARFVDLKPGEGRAVAWGFLYFFSLLCGYYVLRPLREEMGIQGGVRALPWMFTVTFVVMLAAVPLYSWAVASRPRRHIVPVVYRFFLANVLLFWALFAWAALPPESAKLAARAFFVWTAVYNLFVVSVFWSVLADLFTSDSAKRLFGFIAAGGTAGALLGPVIAAALLPFTGTVHLLLVPALLLEVSVFCVRRLFASAPARTDAPAAGDRVGGGVFDGITEVVRSRYLLAIAAQTLLFACVSTFVYLRQQAIVAAAIEDSAARTQLFAYADFFVNLLALTLQSLATGAILARLGLGAGLGAVPAFGVVALPVLAAAPGLLAVVGASATRRGLHYGVEKPAREALFTVVRPAEKYKAKSFVDTVVYRGADAVAGWAYAGLEAVKAGTPAIFLSGVPFAAAGVGLAAWLSRAHARRSSGTGERPDGPPETR